MPVICDRLACLVHS